MKNGKEKSMFVREYLWRDLMTVCGLFVILLTIVIGAFLVYKGSSTFLVYRHSFLEFLGSADWAPEDNMAGGGSIGALIFIAGSLCTCGLALLIATPFSLGSAIFITEISPEFGEKFYRPVVEIFAGIPSVVYGWVGLTVLVPAIKTVFDRQVGHSILAAGLVLAVMIFPTITSVAADALHSVPKECRMAAYGLGSTRWQTINQIVVPAAAPGMSSPRKLPPSLLSKIRIFSRTGSHWCVLWAAGWNTNRSPALRPSGPPSTNKLPWIFCSPFPAASPHAFLNIRSFPPVPATSGGWTVRTIS